MSSSELKVSVALENGENRLAVPTGKYISWVSLSQDEPKLLLMGWVLPCKVASFSGFQMH